jgi:hypothetical protein
MPDCVLRGEIGRQLSITLTEEIHEFELLHLRSWRGGKLFSLIPEEERGREAKYKTDEFRRRHFAELTTMTKIRREGYTSWLYDDFLLFRDPPPGEEAVYAAGTARAKEIFGEELFASLRQAADQYGSGKHRAIEPDLIAWRDEGGVRQFRAIECGMEYKGHDEKGRKRKYRDAVADGKVLGLTLLRALVPNCEVAIHRLTDRDLLDELKRERRAPAVYQRSYEPRRGSSPPATAAHDELDS